jgi:hypothetical protein
MNPPRPDKIGTFPPLSKGGRVLAYCKTFSILVNAGPGILLSGVSFWASGKKQSLNPAFPQNRDFAKLNKCGITKTQVLSVFVSSW